MFRKLLFLDWMTLRQNHRIIGELIGPIANFPRQNSHPGLVYIYTIIWIYIYIIYVKIK